MLGSFKIGSVLGITVRVHWLFLALVLFLLMRSAAQGGPDSAQVLLGLTLLFGIVFLHELGHSLVARRFGLQVYDITFWPLGGMARMSEIPESTRVELLIALAGPAVNFVLAALAAPVAVWSGMAVVAEGGPAWVGTVAAISSLFVGINLALGVFNLLPAFPMDGGRVLRALLGRSGDWVRATERAVAVGRILAIGMVLAGLVLFDRGLLLLPVIGLFVWFAGARELWAVRLRHGRIPFGPAAGKSPLEAFGVAPPPPTRPAPDGAPRPPTPPLDGARGRPLSETDIEELERFRGPLRQFRQPRA